MVPVDRGKAKRLGLGEMEKIKKGKQEGEETQVKKENGEKCLMKKALCFCCGVSSETSWSPH